MIQCSTADNSSNNNTEFTMLKVFSIYKHKI